MYYIDTHCHLSENDNVKEIMNKCYEVSVNKIIISGCDFESIPSSIKIANEMDSIFLSLGFHPEVADIVTSQHLQKLIRQIESNKKIVAVGEIGLDFHYGKQNSQAQIALFRNQLEIAEKFNLPVVIHTRDAIELTYQILKEYNVHGVIHCFSGSLEMANKFIKLGYYLGIGGVLTFKNCKLKEVLNKIPITSIVLETDSPYLAPAPHRGSTNYPYYIPCIATEIAHIYNIDEVEVARITTANASRVFDRMK